MSRTKAPTLNIIFGAMTFGKPGAEQTRVHSLPACSAILDVFQRHGHREIDTARFYGEGSSEEYLGQLDWQKRGLIMDTKYYPTAGRTMSKSNEPAGGWKHTPEHLRQNLMDSLMALKTDNVDMWYLHGPDRTTDFEITLNAVNELHREGYFRRFGISNYMAWEVARICEICREKGYIMPSVYQGLYNALHRSVEPELFECLRHYGVAFYNYNPLAGGYLTSTYKTDMKDEELESGPRFDPQKAARENVPREILEQCVFRRPGYPQAGSEQAWSHRGGVCFEVDDASFKVEGRVWRRHNHWSEQSGVVGAESEGAGGSKVSTNGYNHSLRCWMGEGEGHQW